MPSSRTERLHELRTIYNDGLEAALHDDFEQVGRLIDRADELIATLPEAESQNSDEVEARDAAREAWGKLRGALAAATEDTRNELSKVRRSRRVTRCYGKALHEQRPRLRAEA